VPALTALKEWVRFAVRTPNAPLTKPRVTAAISNERTPPLVPPGNPPATPCLNALVQNLGSLTPGVPGGPKRKGNGRGGRHRPGGAA
jgi:hypothetical protein